MNKFKNCPKSVLPLMFSHIQEMSDLARRILLLNDLQSLEETFLYWYWGESSRGAWEPSWDIVLHPKSCSLGAGGKSLFSWSDEPMSNHLGEDIWIRWRSRTTGQHELVTRWMKLSAKNRLYFLRAGKNVFTFSLKQGSAHKTSILIRVNYSNFGL